MPYQVCCVIFYELREILCKRKDKKMGLLQEWRDIAYSQEKESQRGQMFWANYFNMEKGIYQQLLAEPEIKIKGTIKQLAEKYGIKTIQMVGFLDGINESLIKPNPIEDMEKDTEVHLEYDKEKLYYNMVAAKADWLYNLEEWDELLSPERRKELYQEQKNSGTIVKGKKVGRNDSCPCGSGKKFKQCCINA